ncbi:MAG: hypothetical protein N3G19_00570 [Candidatus Pacearchaeota archaeon]|nr:hypothetical protein [Candidatus Pacearchaeota archaeon]
MISVQKIAFLTQLVTSAEQIIFDLEQANQLGNEKKLNELKRELEKLNNEIKAEIKTLE